MSPIGHIDVQCPNCGQDIQVTVNLNPWHEIRHTGGRYKAKLQIPGLPKCSDSDEAKVFFRVEVGPDLHWCLPKGREPEAA